MPVKLPLETCYFDSLTVACSYSGPLKKLIKAMKYGHAKDAATWCGQLLYLTTNPPLTECVTSVPLHPAKQRWRGYNQAELMAQEYATKLQLPHASLLKRVKQSATQAQVRTKQKRLHNLDESFDFVPQADLPASVTLIDDVVTTGSTLNECARVLKANGIKTVHCLTVAHGW